jgi:putative hydrolase of HD superfamily
VTDQSDLLATIEIVLESDRLKQVVRRNWLADGSRRENTAEHSWYLALMGILLHPWADGAPDLAHTLQLVILHDLVEIDAGDTFVYDTAGRADKAAIEAQAAERIFGALPDPIGSRCLALWREWEEGVTAEACFGRALDRLAPLLLNHASGGAVWREHGIAPEQVRALNSSIDAGSSALWALAQQLIDDAEARRMFRASPDQPS